MNFDLTVTNGRVEHGMHRVRADGPAECFACGQGKAEAGEVDLERPGMH